MAIFQADRLLRPKTLTATVILVCILVQLNYSNLLVFRIQDSSLVVELFQEDTTAASPMEQQTNASFGKWINDTWIPPWNRYSTSDLQRIFRKAKSVLFVGDSTARRAFLTLYGILNGKDYVNEDTLNANKGGVITEPCSINFRQTPNVTSDICRTLAQHHYIYTSIQCLRDLQDFVTNELEGATNYTAHVDTVVLAFGIWHALHYTQCRVLNQSSVIESIVQDLERLQANRSLTIFWRTSGFDGRNKNSHVIRKFNRDIRSALSKSKSIKLVDWGTVIEEKSFGESRIIGDIPPHYGFEARMAFVQMLANQVYREIE